MTKLRFIFCFLVVCQVSAWAKVSAFTRWIDPSRLGERWEQHPLERTRPLVVGDILYYSNLSGDVMAVHRLEGYPLWKKRLPAGVEGALTYARSKIFVGDTAGNLFALSARDGSEIWKFKIQSEWLSAPTVLRDKVFVSSSNDEIFALSEQTGKELWHYSHRGDEKMTVRGTGSPAVYGNEVFQGFSDGYLVGLSAVDGKILWEKKLRSRERFYDVDMAPYVDDQSVIAATFDGKLYSLNRMNGESQWVASVGSYGGFLVENDVVFFSGLNGYFHALDRKTGSVKWKTPFMEGIGLTPTRVGELIVIPTSSDPLYLIQPKDGEVVWKGGLGAGTLAPVAASGDDQWFYCLSNYGVLYSFEVLRSSPFLQRPETVATPSAIQRHRDFHEAAPPTPVTPEPEKQST